jgi:hypothetical protein
LTGCRLGSEVLNLNDVDNASPELTKHSDEVLVIKAALKLKRAQDSELTCRAHQPSASEWSFLNMLPLIRLGVMSKTWI